MKEFGVFAIFLGMQFGFSHCEVWLEHKSRKLKRRLKKCGWLLWLCHPHVLTAGHEFLVVVVEHHLF